MITFKMPNSYETPGDSTPSYPTVPDMANSHEDQQPAVSEPDTRIPAMSHTLPVPASPARCTPPPTQTPYTSYTNPAETTKNKEAECEVQWG